MTASANRLPILQTVKEAVSLAASSFATAISITGLPLVGALAAVAVGGFVGNAVLAVVTFIAFLLTLVCSIWAVMIVAQAKALGIDLPTRPGALFLHSRFWKYGGASIATTFATLAISIPAILFAALLFERMQGLAAAVMIVGLLLSFYVGLRLFLVLPAIAAGHPAPFEASWRLTYGNTLAIACSLCLSLFPVWIVQSVTEELSKDSETAAAKIAGSIVVLLIAVVQAAVMGAVGGVAYRNLSAVQAD